MIRKEINGYGMMRYGNTLLSSIKFYYANSAVRHILAIITILWLMENDKTSMNGRSNMYLLWIGQLIDR